MNNVDLTHHNIWNGPPTLDSTTKIGASHTPTITNNSTPFAAPTIASTKAAKIPTSTTRLPPTTSVSTPSPTEATPLPTD